MLVVQLVKQKLIRYNISNCFWSTFNYIADSILHSVWGYKLLKSCFKLCYESYCECLGCCYEGLECGCLSILTFFDIRGYCIKTETMRTL